MTRKRGARWVVRAYDETKGVTVQADDDGGHQVFDELVVEGWLRVEQTDRATWWVRLGSMMCTVTVGRDGKIREQTAWEEA